MGTPLDDGLVRLEPVKLDLVRASDRAGETVRDCATCDAHCCRVGFNSMLVSRIEAVAIARRLREPDLIDRVEEIRDRARREIDRRGLIGDPYAEFDCPLLDGEGRCLVHGPAQPAGCLTFMPVDDGGCDHDLEGFDRALPRIEAAERRAFGDVEEPRPIPIAILAALAGDAEPIDG
jgi:Fe-S-cluster containining protein